MRHGGEISFYDELGLASDAKAEEIRDSFRALVRILHPDHQTDPLLKEIAERQMRKLNRVHAVLSDPEKRRLYDQALRDDGIRPAFVLSSRSSVNTSRVKERAAWIAALAMVVAILIWLSSENPASSQPQVSERSSRNAPAQVDTAEEFARMQSDLHLVKMERDAAVHELARLRALPARTQYLWRPTESVASAAPNRPP